MVILLAAGVSAVVQITEPEVKLNVDYIAFNDEDQTKISVNAAPFTLTNDGTADVTVRIEATGLPTGYTFTTKDVIVPANGSILVSESNSFKIEVPHEKDGGEETIGAIKVSVAGVQQDTAVLKQVTKQMLIIKELEVKYINEDGDSKPDTFKDEEKTDLSLSKNVLINTEMILEFTLRNLFDNDYDEDDSDMESIELDIEPDDNDLFSEDPEETYDLEDMAADEKQDFSVTFMIDEEAEAGEHTITISLSGEDGKGSKYSLEKELKFEVERKKDDVRVYKTKILPTVITACDASFTFEAELKNYGTDDQNKAGFSVYNEALGINENIPNIEVQEFEDDDNTWSQKFTFNLDQPEAKDYYLDLRAYVNLDESTDSQMVKLTISPCADATTGTESQDTTTDPGTDDLDYNEGVDGNDDNLILDDNVIVIDNSADNSDQSETTSNTLTNPVRSIERTYNDEDFLVGGIIVVIVLLVAMVGLFVVIMIRK